MAILKVWNSQKHTAEQALDLKEGVYVADFGIRIQQSVESDHTLEAAQALIDANIEVTAASQAKIIVLAQEKGVAFTDWAGVLSM